MSPDPDPVSEPDPAATPRLYSVEHAAAILDVTPRFVWNLIQEGVLTRVKVGSRTRVRDDELAAWLNRNADRGLG